MHRYQTLIDGIQFFGQPEISWNGWFHEACIDGESLTPLGMYLADTMNEGVFVDVPCGLRKPKKNEEYQILRIAQRLGSSIYIEVDKDETIVCDRMEHPARTKKTEIETYQSDLLEYISEFEKLPNTTHLTMYLSGLQFNPDYLAKDDYQKEIAVPYLHALYTELGRISNVGDFVIFNDAESLVSGIDESRYSDSHPIVGLTRYGFQQTKSCPRNKVQIYEKV